MAKKVTDALDEVRIAAFTADITSINGDDVTLKIKSVLAFQKGLDVRMKSDFVTVSRDQDFMKRYPQGSVGSHVEGVVITEAGSNNHKYKHIVCPV